MSVSVKMPQLGESVTEGTITRWLKNVGDHVNADEPLVEISTDKVDTEIPSPVTGILLSLAAQEDDVVEVGAELAVIGEESEVGAPAEAPAPVASPAEAPAPVAPPAAPPVTPPVAAEEAAPAPAPAAAGAESIIVLPALGESVTEGTITRWLKSEGDAVAVDEPIVEISTDKVDTEIPAAVAGVLIKITAPEDSVIEVGGELGRIGSSVAATPAPAAPTTPAPAAPTTPAPAAPTAPTTPASAAPAESTQTGYVTPLVRRMASDAGVDLTTVTGTGAGGRITKTDVVAASAGTTAAPTATAPPAPTPPSAPTPPPLPHKSPTHRPRWQVDHLPEPPNPSVACAR